MNKSDAMSILNCAFDNPCFFTHGVHKLFYFFEYRIFQNHRLRIQACLFFKLILEISIAGWKCLCVSGMVVLWPKHVDIIISVPMSYVKRWNSKKINKFSVKVEWIIKMRY